MASSNLLQSTQHLLNQLRPAMLLILRVWIASVFWKSGLVRLESWENTVMLFTYEHPVPFLPPEVAAFFATVFELLCPVLLTLGLAARAATLPLLMMTAVIQFTYQDNVHHYYWAMILGTILCFGPGRWSLDQWLWRRWI